MKSADETEREKREEQIIPDTNGNNAKSRRKNRK